MSSTYAGSDGHEVVGVDTDENKLALIRKGESPIVEQGVRELTSRVVEAGNLTVAKCVDERVADCDVIFVCVGTPSAENGSQDLTAIRRVTSDIGKVLGSANKYPVVVYRSTLEPGSTTGYSHPRVMAPTLVVVTPHFS